MDIADLGGGIHRITFPMPLALNHVHCYAVAGSDGWTVIDTGLGRGAEERWRDALAALGEPRVRTIVITHYHPDHVGGGAALARLTGADVLQGRFDAEQTRIMHTDPRDIAALRRHLREHGMPAERVEESVATEQSLLASPAAPTRLLDAGDEAVVGDERFTVLVLPGHADGHIALWNERTRTLFAGDTIMERITPNVSTWQHSLPDPLARYLRTLERIAALRPAIAYPGHHGPLEDAAGRAREIREHHRVRLDEHERALRGGAETTFEVAERVWGRDLTIHEVRFAVGEAISHLVRLVALGRVAAPAPGRWRAAT